MLSALTIKSIETGVNATKNFSSFFNVHLERLKIKVPAEHDVRQIIMERLFA